MLISCHFLIPNQYRVSCYTLPIQCHVVGQVRKYENQQLVNYFLDVLQILMTKI